jgi:3',5'-cyclic AMP phosphodiesterase CpdA
MVISGSPKKKIFPVFVFCISILISCNIRYYNDYDSRFAWYDDVRVPALNPPLGESYSFIVMSDTHIINKNYADRFAVIKSIITADDRFIVITGDITDDGTEEQIQCFLDACALMGIPCYPVIGNHDIQTERGKYWKELIGSTVYRIDSSDTSLFFLDNANGAFGYEQLEWFETELKTAGKNTFVFTHENFFIDSAPPDNAQITDFRERARVMALVKNRCSAVFMGHLHKRVVKELDGVTYIMQEDYVTDLVFCRVYVSNSGFSWEIIDELTKYR